MRAPEGGRVFALHHVSCRKTFVVRSRAPRNAHEWQTETSRILNLNSSSGQIHNLAALPLRILPRALLASRLGGHCSLCERCGKDMYTH
jgi:hypothetical protein